MIYVAKEYNGNKAKIRKLSTTDQAMRSKQLICVQII